MHAIDGGLVTLSRFPILESENLTYSVGVFSDSLAAKGALYTKIEIKGEHMLVFNTHTNASYVSTDVREVKASLEARELQTIELRDFINVKIDLYRE